jgi:hypothetical protein
MWFFKNSSPTPSLGKRRGNKCSPLFAREGLGQHKLSVYTDGLNLSVSKGGEFFLNYQVYIWQLNQGNFRQSQRSTRVKMVKVMA